MNNSTRIIEEFYATFSFWFNGMLTLVLLVIGVVGNVAIFSSFRYKTRHWLALFFYFLTFALWNTTLLVSSAFLYCFPALSASLAEDPLYVHLRYYSYPLANISLTATFWLAVVVTIERYCAATKPLCHRTSKKKYRAKLISMLICIISPIYNAPLFFDLVLTNSDTDNCTCHIEMSPMRRNVYYQIWYRGVANSLFVTALPLCVISVLSIRMIIFLQKRKGISKKISNSSVKSSCSPFHQKLTHIFLTFITLKFVVCQTFPVALNVLELQLDKNEFMYRVMVDVSNMMVVLDSASNSFLYLKWRQKIKAHRLSFRSGYVNKTIALTPVMITMLAAAMVNTQKKRLPSTTVDDEDDEEDSPSLGEDVSPSI